MLSSSKKPDWRVVNVGVVYVCRTDKPGSEIEL